MTHTQEAKAVLDYLREALSHWQQTRPNFFIPDLLKNLDYVTSSEVGKMIAESEMSLDEFIQRASESDVSGHPQFSVSDSATAKITEKEWNNVKRKIEDFEWRIKKKEQFREELVNSLFHSNNDVARRLDSLVENIKSCETVGNRSQKKVKECEATIEELKQYVKKLDKHIYEFEEQLGMTRPEKPSKKRSKS